MKDKTRGEFMGIYFKMAIAYLRKNKLRTLLLILGVVLGILLVFSLNVIENSKDKNDLNASQKLYGGYHVEGIDLKLEDTKKLKDDKNVSKVTTVQNLGNLVDKKGNSILLKSSDKDYLIRKSSKVIKGRLPKNNDEIVIEKRALDSMNISNQINSIVNLTVKKEYKDSNGNNQIHTVDKSFKLVGIIEKPEEYYDLVYELEAFTYGNDENNNIIPNDIVSYDSMISFKSGWKDIKGQSANLMERTGLGRYNCIMNVPFMTKTIDLEGNQDDYKKEILIIVTATIFIFNIFNITLNQMIKEMGLLRLMGSSKKNIKAIIIYQALIIMIVGIILGLVVGVIYSYIGINNYNTSFYESAKIKAKLYISNKDIIKAILVGVFSVIISCIIPIIKISKISPIEAIRQTEKVKAYSENYKLNRVFTKIFGFYGFMGIKNIGRNKSRAIISMISIALGGYVFITTFSSMQDEAGYKIENIYNKYDVTMSFVDAVSDLDNLTYTDNDIDKIKKIDGVSSVNKSYEVSAIFNFKKDEVNKEFTKYNGIKENNTMEYDMNFKIYQNDYINKTLKNFIDKGDLTDIGKITDGYINVVVYNYFYDVAKDHVYKNVFKDINPGDIITIKIPVIENGKSVYKENKVRVCATLKPDWAFRGDGGDRRNLEIMTSSNHSILLIGEQKYTRLGISLKDPYNKKVNSKIEEISNRISSSRFESKLNFREMGKAEAEEYLKSQISIIILVLAIAGINIFCTIRTNLLMRRREISTLRAIGLSSKNMRKMVVYEALAYAVLSFIISLVLSLVNLVGFVNEYNKAYKNFGIEKFMAFTFPLKESITFFIIAIIVCLIAVVISNRDFKKLNIIEGIKDND